MRSLHPADAAHKGFGTIPTSILQRKNGVCIDKSPACRNFGRTIGLANKFIVFPCARFYSTIGIGHGSLTVLLIIFPVSFIL